MAETLKVYMARVFSAVEVEDEGLLDELVNARNHLDLGFSPVKKEKMHVTLEFFRDVDEQEIDELKKAMNNIDIDDFKARASGVGCFPSKEHIRVIWAGLQNEESFYRLYRQLSSHKVVSDNNHDFKPHITLLRVKNIDKDQKRKLKRSLREFEGHSFGEMNVKRVKLFRSDLGGGSGYRELHSCDL